MKIIEIDAPASWASYLINGDDSGYTYDENREINMWLHGLSSKLTSPLGIKPDSYGDVEFMAHFDFPLEGTMLCTMCTYLFPIEGE